MKLVKRILKVGWEILLLVGLGALYLIPVLVFFAAAVEFSCNWSLGWIFAATLVGCIQVFILALVASFFVHEKNQRKFVESWNLYVTRWKEAGIAQAEVLRIIYEIVNALYEDQVKRQNLFTELFGGLGGKEDIIIPKGMEDVCKKVKF